MFVFYSKQSRMSPLSSPLIKCKKVAVHLRWNNIPEVIRPAGDRVLTMCNSPTSKRRTLCNLPDNSAFAKEQSLLSVHVGRNKKLKKKEKPLVFDRQAFCFL